MKLADVRVGQRVVYCGPSTVPVDGTLEPGRPGTLFSVDTITHVQARWVGMENGPESELVGFTFEGDSYPDLLIVSDPDWETLAQQYGWQRSRS